MKFKELLKEMSLIKSKVSRAQISFEFYIDENDEIFVDTITNGKKKTMRIDMLLSKDETVDTIFNIFRREKLIFKRFNSTKDKISEIKRVIRAHFKLKAYPYDLIIRNKMVIVHTEE